MDEQVVAYIQFNTQNGWTDETASNWLVERHFRTRYYKRNHPDYSGRYINYFQTPLKRLRRNLESVDLSNGITIFFGFRRPRNCVKTTEKINNTTIYSNYAQSQEI